MQHHILRSEAGEAHPLAYIQVYPPGRRVRGRYLAAGVMGAVLALLALVLLGLIAGAMSASMPA